MTIAIVLLGLAALMGMFLAVALTDEQGGNT